MRFRLLAPLLVALAVVPAAAARPVFVVTGHGWGHGIGMSQWGALGFAEHGYGYEAILDHYYPGTGQGTASRTVSVVLASGRTAVTIGSASSWTLQGSGGKTWTLAAGSSRTIGASLRVRLGGKVRQLGSPVTVDSAGGVVALDHQGYRGRFLLEKVGSTMTVVNRVGLEKYLRGVVPCEMPASWLPDALKAQAVAARTYAVTHQSLSATTSSQVYRGLACEAASSTAAVKATAGEIRTEPDGDPAQTFFYSSSGGWTAANEDVWGGAPISYLRSVRDPYDAAGGANPHHSWSLAPLRRSAMAARLGSRVLGTLRDLVVSVDSSRRASSVAIVGRRGTTTATGSTFRDVLGLQSTFFRIGVLDLRVARSTIAKGATVRVHGRARGARSAWLERKRGTGAWSKVTDLTLGDDGTWATKVSPGATTSYRVAVRRMNGVRLPQIATSVPRTIRVTARAALFRPTDRTGLGGVVSTREADVAVAVERHTAGGWRVVARGWTHGGGVFRVPFVLRDGTYRVAVVGAGRVLSVTSPLTVVGS